MKLFKRIRPPKALPRRVVFNLKLPPGQSTGQDTLELGPEYHRLITFDQDGTPVLVLPCGVTIRSGVVPDADTIDVVKDYFLLRGGRLTSAL